MIILNEIGHYKCNVREEKLLKFLIDKLNNIRHVVVG